jgi:hypothetical protein
LYANQVVITSINNTINLVNNTNFPGFPTNLTSIIITNRTGIHNSFKLVIDGTTNQPAIGFFAATNRLTNGMPNFTGTILGLEQNSPNIKLWVADPRMLPYRGIGSSYSYSDIPYTNTIWGSYPARINPFVSGSPANWSDGTNTLNSTLSTSGSNYIATQAPNIGITSISDPAPCKISNFGSYTNICELGNIFDPIQWAPPIATNNYANCDINTNTGSAWTKNNMYGGGSTLRIGRPEHSLFAFTNFANSGTPIPNMGQSAAALLDLFCVTNGNDKGGPFRTGGKININTAPYPVLAALAGGVTITKDPNQVGSTVNTNMINSFATGVMKFRHLYPFLTPSQLLFISVNYGDANWTNSLVWGNAAVFSKNHGLKGVTSISDEGLEEWFSKIYQLSAVSSENYRVYIVAQLVDTNRMPTSPQVRKYVHFTSRPNNPTVPPPDTTFGVPLYNWTITKPTKKTYESPY